MSEISREVLYYTSVHIARIFSSLTAYFEIIYRALSRDTSLATSFKICSSELRDGAQPYPRRLNTLGSARLHRRISRYCILMKGYRTFHHKADIQTQFERGSVYLSKWCTPWFFKSAVMVNLGDCTEIHYTIHTAELTFWERTPCGISLFGSRLSNDMTFGAFRCFPDHFEPEVFNPLLWDFDCLPRAISLLLRMVSGLGLSANNILLSIYVHSQIFRNSCE